MAVESRKTRIGVLGCSGVAERSVLPALVASEGLDLVAVASRRLEHATKTAASFGCQALTYDEIIQSADIDAVYISLPNSLHYEWGMRALESGKHILVEKPFTDSLRTTRDLVERARVAGKVAMEGLMYVFHPAINTIHDLIQAGAIGQVRCVEAAFGFPYLADGDNRNNPDLGGGAILDNLVYPLSFCLGFSDAAPTNVDWRILGHERHAVDARGFVRIDWPEFSGVISYGFGFAYRNEIRVWGDRGILTLDRAFTAPATREQEIHIAVNGDERVVRVEAQDHFALMLEEFRKRVAGESTSDVNAGRDIQRRMAIIDRLLRSSESHDGTVPEVSVIIPVYRSEEVLAETVDEIAEALRPWCEYEIILVNDASPDGSGVVVDRLAAESSHVRPIHLMKNFGQHNAIMAGLHAMRGRCAVLMDDDGQHDPSCIRSLVARLGDDVDVVYASLDEKTDLGFKTLGSRLNDWMAKHLLGKPKDLYLASFKALSRSLVHEVLQYSGPAPYIDGLILTSTNRIATVPVKHRGTAKQESSYTLRKLVLHWLNMFTNFSITPLRLVFLAAAIMGAVSVLGLIYSVIYRLTASEPMPGWATLVVLTLLFGAVQLAGLGLIGEYVGRVLLHLNSRPQFIVRECNEEEPCS